MAYSSRAQWVAFVLGFIRADNVTTKEGCCKACGLDPHCVAGVLKCATPGRQCRCNLKPYNAKYTLSHTTSEDHTDLTCITGRQNISDGGPPDGGGGGEEAVLNWWPGRR